MNRASLTVTAGNFTKVYGAANPAFSATFAGFVLSESPAVLGGALQFATSATAASHVGNHAVTPSVWLAANYDIAFVTGNCPSPRRRLPSSRTAKPRCMAPRSDFDRELQRVRQRRHARLVSPHRQR